MAFLSQKEAAKRFSKKWAGKGKETQDDSKFWLELIQEVFRSTDPYSLIEFQKPVKMESTTRYIDAYIPETRVLIEQKGVDVDLSKKYLQSGGDMLTPYEQARRYDLWMLPDEHPLWIVVCNFKSFEIHDMRRPYEAPEIVLLENLADDYHRLSFITDANRLHIQREQKVSMAAGEIVGNIYDALQAQYINPNDDATKHSLNVLCVRFVFCLYAEDAGIFGKDQFHNYLQGIPAEDMRDAVLKLFDVLDTPEDLRSPYMKGSLKAFPYTNGGLFHDRNIEVPMFTEEIKEVLVEHASDDFDWSAISPTIFGGVFESTLNPEARRKEGMHYTSIENIHKVIDPLFLDDLKEELQRHKDGRPSPGSSKQKLLEWKQSMVEFQEKLAGLKFLDPACGSGNFLTETYLSLRRLENEVLRELADGYMLLDLDEDLIKVSISQFYGIEINDFASDVARTALWISEAQMMEETKNIVQRNMDSLPLKSNSNIHTGNALRMDWNEVISAGELNYIMGNPPFIGYKEKSNSQKDDLISACIDHNGKTIKNTGSLDYVSGWYFKAAQMIQESSDIQASFVSTNSITQGEQVALLWKPLFESYGIFIHFAYRTFIWNSEAKDKAKVHCVIIGISKKVPSFRRIFNDDQSFETCSHINAYLYNSPDVWIISQRKPLSAPKEVTLGVHIFDNHYFIFTEEEKTEFVSIEPLAEPYFKKWISASDFLYGKCRWYLDLQNCPPNELRRMPNSYERVKKVLEYRATNPSAIGTPLELDPFKPKQGWKADRSYIVIPNTSGQNRDYLPIGFQTPDVVVTMPDLALPNGDLYDFGIISSSVHMAWIRVVCGRLKSDYRYANGLVYNNYPWPQTSETQIIAIEHTALNILNIRSNYPDCSLADLYDSVAMPSELRKAHKANDAAVMEAYGFRKDMTEPEIVAELFKMYQKLVENK